MPPAEVRCAGVSYFVEQDALLPDGKQGKIRVRHEATRGDIIDLTQAEFDRLAELEAVQEPGSASLTPTGTVQTLFTIQAPLDWSVAPEQPSQSTAPLTAPAADGPVYDLTAASDAQVQSWLSDEKPTVEQVVDAVGDDPALARRVLDAEHATDGDARTTLVTQLESIIDKQS